MEAQLQDALKKFKLDIKSDPNSVVDDDNINIIKANDISDKNIRKLFIYKNYLFNHPAINIDGNPSIEPYSLILKAIIKENSYNISTVKLDLKLSNNENDPSKTLELINQYKDFGNKTETNLFLKIEKLSPGFIYNELNKYMKTNPNQVLPTFNEGLRITVLGITPTATGALLMANSIGAAGGPITLAIGVVIITGFIGYKLSKSPMFKQILHKCNPSKMMYEALGLNIKARDIGIASKLYETYLQVSINSSFTDDLDIDTFFKDNQLYKRLAKKFVLTQTSYTKYNENDIFDKSITIVSSIFAKVDELLILKKHIEKNVAINDSNLFKLRAQNYMAFYQIKKEIETFIDDDEFKMFKDQLSKSLTTKRDQITEILEKYTFSKEKLKTKLEEIADILFMVKEPSNEDVNKYKTYMQELKDEFGIDLLTEIKEAEEEILKLFEDNESKVNDSGTFDEVSFNSNKDKINQEIENLVKFKKINIEKIIKNYKMFIDMRYEALSNDIAQKIMDVFTTNKGIKGYEPFKNIIIKEVKKDLQRTIFRKPTETPTNTNNGTFHIYFKEATNIFEVPINEIYKSDEFQFGGTILNKFLNPHVSSFIAKDADIAFNTLKFLIKVNDPNSPYKDASTGDTQTGNIRAATEEAQDNVSAIAAVKSAINGMDSASVASDALGAFINNTSDETNRVINLAKNVVNIAGDDPVAKAATATALAGCYYVNHITTTSAAAAAITAAKTRIMQAIVIAAEAAGDFTETVRIASGTSGAFYTNNNLSNNGNNALVAALGSLTPERKQEVFDAINTAVSDAYNIGGADIFGLYAAAAAAAAYGASNDPPAVASAAVLAVGGNYRWAIDNILVATSGKFNLGKGIRESFGNSEEKIKKLLHVIIKEITDGKLKQLEIKKLAEYKFIQDNQKIDEFMEKMNYLPDQSTILDLCQFSTGKKTDEKNYQLLQLYTKYYNSQLETIHGVIKETLIQSLMKDRPTPNRGTVESEVNGTSVIDNHLSDDHPSDVINVPEKEKEDISKYNFIKPDATNTYFFRFDEEEKIEHKEKRYKFSKETLELFKKYREFIHNLRKLSYINTNNTVWKDSDNEPVHKDRVSEVIPTFIKSWRKNYNEIYDAKSKFFKTTQAQNNLMKKLGQQINECKDKTKVIMDLITEHISTVKNEMNTFIKLNETIKPKLEELNLNLKQIKDYDKEIYTTPTNNLSLPIMSGGGLTSYNHESNYESYNESNNEENDYTTQIGGETSFNKEQRSSSNRKFTTTNIDNFMKYFKIITYDLKLKIEINLPDEDSKSILESFINKYLNILVGEKVNDGGLTEDDGIIEKYKNSMINPKFLTEKIGSIGSYITLSEIIVNQILDDALEKVLTIKDDNDGGQLKVIRFELIKNDLITILIENFTNISTIKLDVMKPGFVNNLKEKFTSKFLNKLGLQQQEKELSKETQELLNTIFAPQFSDSKTMQNYKKQLREIDNIIENKAKTETLDFVNVFTVINDKKIFNTKFDLNPNGITINLGDGVDLQDAKEKQNSFEKDQILKLLRERAFSKSSIDIINDALKDNTEKTEQLEETPARVI